MITETLKLIYSMKIAILETSWKPVYVQGADDSESNQIVIVIYFELISLRKGVR